MKTDMDIAIAIGLVRRIDWRSIDKDNMEFSAKLSCYQLDAIRTLIKAAEPLAAPKLNA